MPGLSKAIQEKRAPLVLKMQEILKRASENDGVMSAEDEQLFDELDTKQVAIQRSSDRAAKLDEYLSEDDIADDPDTPDEPVRRHTPPKADPPEQANFGKALRGWLLSPAGKETRDDCKHMEMLGVNPNSKQLSMSIPIDYLPPRTIEEAYCRLDKAREPEHRAQSIGTTTAGGFTVPDEMMASIEIALLQFGPMRQVSTIVPTRTGADLPWPTTNDTATEGEIINENTTANEGDVTFGQIVLSAYKFSSKMVRVSYELLQDSNESIPALLGRLLGERIARILNRKCTVGVDTTEPNGIVTAATDSAVTFAAAQYTWEELLNLKHTVDPAYRGQGAAWMSTDAGYLLCKKIVSASDELPLWLPNLRDGAIDRFDGDPFLVNQHMASGSAAKGIIYGMMPKYHMRQVMEFNLIRLDERYAELAQVAFLGWSRWDGELIDAGTHPVKYATNKTV